MNVIALGTAGLRGWRTKAADVLAPRPARRLAPTEEQIRAAIGALLLALRDYRLRKLLTRRESLATAAAEHLAHDLIADPLWQAVDQVEEQLCREFPAVWERSYPDWVAADTACLHSVDRPAPDSCWICWQRHGPETEIRPAS